MGPTMTARAAGRAGASAVRCLLAASSLCLLAAAAPLGQGAGYAIGKQDVLNIVVFQQPDLSGKFTVENDGTISFPLLGRTKVEGLTVQAAEQTLQTLLAEGFVRKPQVTIVVEQYRSQQIFVMGEVKSPGGYPFTGTLTLLGALALAGGATETAGWEVLLVRPASPTDAAGPTLPSGEGESSQATRIDLTELQRRGAVGTLALQPGDTLFIPRAETVFVFGHVSKPGEYAIRKGTTLLQALSLAGGLTDRGSTKRIKVRRIVDGTETELSLKLQDLVKPGDTIVVKERFF